jgi:hypothetical protein
MKRRLTSVAAAVVLADVLLLGSAWHLAPALSLTAALAVPAAEPLLAPFHEEPAREDVVIDGDGPTLRAHLYRPVRAQRSLILVRDTLRPDDGIASLARALARRGVAVVVPSTTSTSPTTLHGYATSLGMPADVASVSAFDEDQGPRSPLTRAAYAWRLFRLSRALLTPR